MLDERYKGRYKFRPTIGVIQKTLFKRFDCFLWWNIWIITQKLKKKGKCQIENQHLGILNLQLSSIMSKTSTSLPLMSDGHYLKEKNGNGGKTEGCFNVHLTLVTFKWHKSWFATLIIHLFHVPEFIFVVWHWWKWCWSRWHHWWQLKI